MIERLASPSPMARPAGRRQAADGGLRAL